MWCVCIDCDSNHAVHQHTRPPTPRGRNAPAEALEEVREVVEALQLHLHLALLVLSFRGSLVCVCGGWGVGVGVCPSWWIVCVGEGSIDK